MIVVMAGLCLVGFATLSLIVLGKGEIFPIGLDGIIGGFGVVMVVIGLRMNYVEGESDE